MSSYVNPKRAWTGAFIPNWLLSRTEISSNSKLIYARLCQYANDQGVAWPRQETLQAEVGMELRTVQRSLKELVNAGLLEVAQRGRGRSNMYRFPKHEWMISNNTTDLSPFTEDTTDMSGPDTTNMSHPIVKGSKEKKHSTGNSKGATTNAKATRFKEDWTLSPAEREYAEGRGFEASQIDDISEDFRTYYGFGPGRNKTYIDWTRCWQSWVRRERPRRATPASRDKGNKDAGHLRLVAAADQPDPFGIQAAN